MNVNGDDDGVLEGCCALLVWLISVHYSRSSLLLGTWCTGRLSRLNTHSPFFGWLGLNYLIQASNPIRLYIFSNYECTQPFHSSFAPVEQATCKDEPREVAKQIIKIWSFIKWIVFRPKSFHGVTKISHYTFNMHIPSNPVHLHVYI